MTKRGICQKASRPSGKPHSLALVWLSCRSFTPASISARLRIPAVSIRRSRFPAPPATCSPPLPGNAASSSLHRCSSAAQPGIYHNTAVVFEKDGSIAGKYRKMHIPDDPGFYEKFYFTPGDLGFAPIDTSVGRLGVLVCWDQWFPEAARLMALSGAELLIYPTAIGWDPNDTPAEQERQRDAWITVQRSHAIANGLPVISVNRVGFEAAADGSGNGILFWGSSFATGCQGEILAQAGTEGEQLCTVEIDMTRCEDVRRIWPFLRDRRIDSYQDLLKRFCS